MLTDRVDYAQIGLMQQIEVYIVAFHTVLLKNYVDILDAGSDSQLEDLATLHNQRHSLFFNAVVRGNLKRTLVVKHISVRVASETEILKTFAFSNNQRRSTVTKQNRSLTLVPVAEARRFLGGNDQNLFRLPSLNESVRNVQ